MTNRQIPEVTPEAWANTQRSLQRQAHHKRQSIIVSHTISSPLLCQVVADVSLTLQLVLGAPFTDSAIA
jgi:hypothetical protein